MSLETLLSTVVDVLGTQVPAHDRDRLTAALAAWRDVPEAPPASTGEPHTTEPAPSPTPASPTPEASGPTTPSVAPSPTPVTQGGTH